MRLSKTMLNAVEFANWCVNHSVDPYDAAELITLANRAFKAGEYYCNTGDDSRSTKCDALFEDKAKSLGFSVTWPGLWPSLKDSNNRDIYLPSF